MSFLVDTTVLSEFTKPRPNDDVLAWLLGVDTDSLFMSAITIFEVQVGIELLPEGKRKRNLARWLEEEIPDTYDGRILAVSAEVANAGARIVALARKQGWNDLEMDALIAATALIHGMPVATMNRKHFERLGVELVAF